jgi:hypothetical protein
MCTRTETAAIYKGLAGSKAAICYLLATCRNLSNRMADIMSCTLRTCTMRKAQCCWTKQTMGSAAVRMQFSVWWIVTQICSEGVHVLAEFCSVLIALPWSGMVSSYTCRMREAWCCRTEYTTLVRCCAHSSCTTSIIAVGITIARLGTDRVPSNQCAHMQSNDTT